MGSGPDIPTSLRIPQDDLDEADRLIPLLGQDPLIRAVVGGPPSRAAVLRLAIAEGLQALRTKYTKPPGER
jgi:hypothetical protein